MAGLGTRSRQFLVLLVVFCYVYSTTRADVRSCHSDKREPCRFISMDGSQKDTLKMHHSCLCANNTCCDYDFADPAYIVQLRVDFPIEPLRLKLKFCERIDTLRICDPSEVSLRLTKPPKSPVIIDFYNCRCEDYTDLRIWLSTKYFVRFEYKCGKMPNCTVGQVYFSHARGKGSELHCKCIPPMREERTQWRTMTFPPRCMNPW